MQSAVSRKDLLTATIDPAKSISIVEIEEVTMGANTKAPLHLRQCSTLGIITEGSITFQIEGKEAEYLKAGDVFYEPKNIRIAKFNNESNFNAKFAVFYLLENKNDSTIKILDE